MAGEVAEIEQAIGQENLARVMAGLYNQWWIQRREKENQKELSSKTDIGWGHQIRSYVLQPYRLVKDNRTNFESTSPDKVLDGDLDEFLEQSLYQIK